MLLFAVAHARSLRMVRTRKRRLQFAEDGAVPTTPVPHHDQTRTKRPSRKTDISLTFCRMLPLRTAAEPHAIGSQVLHYALKVVARLGKRNPFDPVDRVDLGVARIAVPARCIFRPGRGRHYSRRRPGGRSRSNPAIAPRARRRPFREFSE